MVALFFFMFAIPTLVLLACVGVQSSIELERHFPSSVRRYEHSFGLSLDSLPGKEGLLKTQRIIVQKAYAHSEAIFMTFSMTTGFLGLFVWFAKQLATHDVVRAALPF